MIIPFIIINYNPLPLNRQNFITYYCWGISRFDTSAGIIYKALKSTAMHSTHKLPHKPSSPLERPLKKLVCNLNTHHVPLLPPTPPTLAPLTPPHPPTFTVSFKKPGVAQVKERALWLKKSLGRKEKIEFPHQLFWKVDR